MNNIEKTPILPSIDNKLLNLKNGLSSIQEERLAGLCEKVGILGTERQCNVLNSIFTTEFKNKNLNFPSAFSKLENPVGTC